MRLNPVDIRQQQFNVRMFRGLDPGEVDAFLEDVAEDLESVLKENALLKEQLAAHEERARAAQELERMLRDTLLTTQKLAEEMKAHAQRDAELLVREAKLKADKIMEDARQEEGRARAEIHQLKRTRWQAVEEIRALLDRYGRLLDEEPRREAGEAG
jgi:cell division initiation protein